MTGGAPLRHQTDGRVVWTPDCAAGPVRRAFRATFGTLRRVSIAIGREPLDGDVALALIAALNEELLVRYPEEGATHFRLDLAEVAPGQGAFLVARRETAPVGCGAFRRLDADAAEIKRMYV